MLFLTLGKLRTIPLRAVMADILVVIRERISLHRILDFFLREKCLFLKSNFQLRTPYVVEMAAAVH